MTLEMEDLNTITDGKWHSAVITVGERGTHVYVDGYLAFCGTATEFLAEGSIEELFLADETAIVVRNFSSEARVLPEMDALALAKTASPLVAFAANRLCDYDTQTVSELGSGTIFARFRVRGVGQGGTILAAGNETEEKLALRISADEISYEVRGRGGKWRFWRAQGDWADGNWHDVAVVAANGAVDIYVDGFREAHIPGQAFFSDVAGIEKVMTGQDCFGARLFGEASKASIFDVPLSDAQLKRLSSISPLRTMALFDRGYEDSISYRIPSLLSLPSGVVIAGADQREEIANDSPNKINFVIRRSADGGKTWGPLKRVLKYPGRGRDGASVIDSCAVYDSRTGRVIVLIDHFPGGIGQPNNEHGVGVDEQGRLVLHNDEGESFLLQKDGEVITIAGESTPYKVDDKGNVCKGERPAGNIYLKDGVDPDQSLLTARTSFLVMLTSDDEGETWSEPIHLNHQVKEEWMAFLGTSPGTGIQLKNGSKAGRLIMPVYYSGDYPKFFSAAVVFSDDGGNTWRRGESPNDGRVFNGRTLDSRSIDSEAASTHESTIIEREDGTLLMLMRNQHPSGRVGVCRSIDGGETWSDVEYHEQIPEIFSQPHSISFEDESGKQILCFANASQMMPYRGNGVLRLSLDEGETWPIARTFNPGHYVYQCLTHLPTGNLGLLWENEWQGLYFTEIPLSWFE
ncbi:MAG: sialidase family protein [Actinomycetaceae bacterium]|nr:sialidase family protein [Actinomycetaceae bacterium]